MIEPTMNAIPARKNMRPTISPAAARLSAKPVSEIAFGVRRDSISRSRISSCVVGRSAAAGCGASHRGLGGAGTNRCRLLGHRVYAVMHARPAERPGVGSGPGQQLLGEQRRGAGGERAEEHVGQVVVAGGDDHERDQQRVQRPQDLAPTSA